MAATDVPASTISGAVGSSTAHDSAHLHVSGEASYTDDISEPRGLLHLAVGMSTRPHALIRSINLDPCARRPAWSM